ncbi:cytochrome P460 family protein [Acidobacterium sp. S8]|uniref:cytochrome P460 family protein n=1 Tax=Acidobacterium sp. S8 TaxID=1641854 RepID=UPI0020B16C54|nr:cytochrome P460 family protein [Acidobacterium sp. S8]
MTEIPTRSAAHKQQEQKTDTRTFMERIAGITIVATAAAALAVSLAKAVNVDDKYSLKSPSGIAFSDFRGYEDWAVVGPARTTEVLKIIVANPAMIKAYKAGTPGNGQPFQEGSRIVKIQWKPKKSKEAPFDVDVADVLAQVFVMEKDSKRFPKNGGGWGYAVFNYDAPSGKFSPDAKSPSDCGNACHTAVKAKDYIFHPYETR